LFDHPIVADAETDVLRSRKHFHLRITITQQGDRIISRGIIVHDDLDAEVALLCEHGGEAIIEQAGAVVVGNAYGTDRVIRPVQCRVLFNHAHVRFSPSCNDVAGENPYSRLARVVSITTRAASTARPTS